MGWSMTRQSSYAQPSNVNEGFTSPPTGQLALEEEDRYVLSPTSPHRENQHLSRNQSPSGASDSTQGIAPTLLHRVHAISLDSATKSQDLPATSHLNLVREIELLRAELNYEQYLKLQHHQHMGTLHRQRVSESGYEAERQTLVQLNKHLKATLSEKQASLDQVREEAGLVRKSHAKWENEYKNRLKVLKEEKKSWSVEYESVKSKSEETKVCAFGIEKSSKRVSNIGAHQ